jgi:hypothetical protein
MDMFFTEAARTDLRFLLQSKAVGHDEVHQLSTPETVI